MVTASRAVCEHVVWRYVFLFRIYPTRRFSHDVVFIPALMYLGFGPIETKAQEYFGVSRISINSMAVLGTGIPILTYPISAKVVDKNGIRTCFLCGTTLVFGGSWIRFLGSGTEIWSYWVFFVGHAIVSMGMAFLNSIPAPFSNRFFPVRERSVATSVAMLAFLVGMAVGQGICSFFENYISEYVLGQAIVLTLPIPIVYMTARNHPPGFQKKNEQEQAKESYSLFKEACKIISRPNVRYMCVAAGFGIGTFNTILSLIDEVAPPSVHDHTSLLSGACFFAPGMIGTVMLAKYCDVTRKYLHCAYFCTTVILLNFIVLCYGWHQDISYLIYPSFGLIGFVGLGIIPLCVELGIELCYEPGHQIEGAVNAVVQTSINIGSAISLYAFDPGNLGLADRDAIFMWAAIVACSLLCMTRIEPDYRRLAFEKSASKQQSTV